LKNIFKKEEKERELEGGGFEERVVKKVFLEGGGTKDGDLCLKKRIQGNTGNKGTKEKITEGFPSS